MALEIERKFLLLNEDWQPQASRSARYRQGYLTEGGRCSIRVRVAGARAFLNIKSATLGIRRTEYEYPLPLAEAQEMLSAFTLGGEVVKTRHFVEYGQHTWEIDVFEGVNQGLVVAEVELADEEEAFERPPWLGQEVSDDPRYYNVYLAHHPYHSW